VTRATLIPQAAQQQPPQGAPPAAAPASGVVTTAVPGARRVAVPAAATVPGPAAVMAPATAAAAAAVQSPAAAPEQGNGDGTPPPAASPPAAQTRVVAIPVAAPDLPAGPVADEPVRPTQEADAVPDPAGDDAAGVAAQAEAPAGADTADTPAQDESPAGAEPVPDEAGEREGDPIPAAGTSSPAAVPLRVRRVPIAEPRGEAGPEAEVEAAASPFDLLRADPPLADEPVDEPSLRPSTAAGARPRFPPAPPAAPPVRVPRSRDRDPQDDITIRAPGRAAPGADRTERRRRPDRIDDYDDEPPRSFASTLRLLLAAIVIVAILIFVATRLFSSSSNSPATPPQSSKTQSHSTTPASPGVVASRITVAVLNGTNTAHLASGAWAKLASRGFRKGAVANAAASNVATSKVAYTHRHRPAALAVAHALGFTAAQVGPVHAATLAQAERNGRRPQVVVTLGADYAQR